MKELLKYLKNYRAECFLAPLFKMLEAVFELLVPVVVASIIDVGIASDNTGFIIRKVMLMAFLAVVGLLVAVTAQYFSAKAATGFATGLRHDLFRHILNLSHKELDELGSSTMITRLTSDVNQAQTGVNMFLRLFLRSPFIVFGAMIAAFLIDAKVALLFLFMIVLLFIAVFVIMKTNIPMLKKVQAALDRITLLTGENLSGNRVIRAFCMEEDEIDNFTGSINSHVNEQVKAGRLSALLNPLTYVIVNVFIVLLIYTGAIKVSNGILTQGQVVALYNYMSQILVELIKLANLIITINKALASANRIADVFKIVPSVPVESLSEDSHAVSISATSQSNNEGKTAAQTIRPEDYNNTDGNTSEYLVEYDHVSFKYNENGDDAITDVDFKVKKGETIGIIGGTGSGKTSIINLLPRFYDVTEGSVRVGGKDVRDIPVDLLRSRIGIVLQKAALFKGTIAQNIRWGNTSASDEDVMKAIELAAADEVVASKGGIDAMVEQEGRNLSGGQRQRLTIARALVRKPEILIFDDSSSALDYATDLKLRTNLKSLDYDPAVFIVSQRTSSIRHADKIIVMDDGKVAGMGTHEELLKDCSVYREIHESQYEREGA
ncbi:MAG: ABC transporter ATP-binding protein/permease [Lachnospiraceae bacterium]|nr:ABC transporter ATP-binding protein/permease [Lachnospiraceae bacterium]